MTVESYDPAHDWRIDIHDIESCGQMLGGVFIREEIELYVDGK